MDEFNVGDCVRLKTGFKNMTVTKVNGNLITCYYEDEKGLPNSKEIPAPALKKCPSDDNDTGVVKDVNTADYRDF